MKNIFENAYLGKAYKTRDGRKVIFYNHHSASAREHAKYVTMILEGQESIYRWYYDGTALDYQEHLDIVSEWEESINKEKLYNIADLWVGNNGCERYDDGIDAFIAGYNFGKKGDINIKI